MQSAISMGLPEWDQAAVTEDQSRYAGDKSLFVQFYSKAVQNNFKSSEAGRPIFDEHEYIRIIVPGDTKATVDCGVTDEHRMRFRVKYETFRSTGKMAESGTPLEMWPQMTLGLCHELKAMHVTTVEQLAAMPDGLAQNIMGSFDLRRRAQAFLDASADESAGNKLQDEIDKRDEQLAKMQSQLDALMAATKVRVKPEAPKE